MNNIVFITGASSDIGLELIKSFRQKCLILAHYNRSNAELLELSKIIKNELVTIQADLSIQEDIDDMLNNISSNYGIPNMIVHLASSPISNIRFKDLDWSQFEKEINISLKSAVIILNRFLPQLAKEKRGKVVIMLSSNVLGVPPKTLTHYTTIKYALLGLMRALASEYGEKNITINAVSPSMIETKFLMNINEKVVEASAYNNPLKRNANVKDIIPAIIFLLSEDSNYLNGVNLPITGGSIF